LKTRIQSIYRYCYAQLHSLIASSLFGYLTLHERLYIAVHENDLYEARQLLTQGASPSFIPVDHKSICSRLVHDSDSMRAYSFETSLSASIQANDSMLYMAVSNNNMPLIKQLVYYHDYGQQGQHTEVVSLCLAVKRSYIHIVEYLIDDAHINPNDSVHVGCQHCKAKSIRTQRYQFPIYRMEQEIVSDSSIHIIETNID
jgi:hypothetical protein